jgi:Protein O-mannosyl-transferase TMEM260-like
MGHPARVASRQAPATKKGRPPKEAPRARRRIPRARPPGRSWEALRARTRRAWQALLEAALLGRREGGRREGGRREGGRGAWLREPLPLTELTRADLGWAAATGLASAGLFATVITSHPGLGDAPETVAGVSSLGILHSPGYPAYVLAAHIFTLLVPFGDEAFRVNLFSLFCASLSVAGVQLLARRAGVARWACSLGALALAVSPGFWFYAGFAKHDIFSGLLFVLGLHLVLAWSARPTTGRLAALAAAIGVGLASSWPLELTILPAVAFVLFVSRRKLTLRAATTAAATGLAVIVAFGGFVMLRAGENPAVNWGDATTIGRLVALVDRADFTPHGPTAQTGAQPGASGQPSHNQVGARRTEIERAQVAGRVGGYATVFGRELGIVGLLLAVMGVVVSLAWRRTAASYPLLIAFAANLIGATVVVGFGSSQGGLDGDLIDEGFVLGCYFVLACWLALGADQLVAVLAGDRVAGRLRRVGRSTVLAPALAVALAAAALVPVALGHWSAVHRDGQPFADRYASAVFRELPPHSVLFILGAELTQPLIYRQVVYHQRPDVTVIAADGLSYGWYRQQLSRRLRISLPPATGDQPLDAARTIAVVARTRPVYLDPRAAVGLKRLVGYRPVGIVSELASGQGPAYVSAPAQLEQQVLQAERQAGFPNHDWQLWPNTYVAQAEFRDAALEVARAYYEHRDFVGMRRALTNTLTIQPGDSAAEQDLALLNRTHGGG